MRIMILFKVSMWDQVESMKIAFVCDGNKSVVAWNWWCIDPIWVT